MCSSFTLRVRQTASGVTAAAGRVLVVALGEFDNTRSFIRDGSTGDALASAATPGVLACGRARPFWLTWRNATLEVGHGAAYGLHLMMGWTAPPGGGDGGVEGVNVTAGARFSTATWEVDQDEGQRPHVDLNRQQSL